MSAGIVQAIRVSRIMHLVSWLPAPHREAVFLNDRCRMPRDRAYQDINIFI